MVYGGEEGGAGLMMPLHNELPLKCQKEEYLGFLISMSYSGVAARKRVGEGLKLSAVKHQKWSQTVYYNYLYFIDNLQGDT